MKMMKMIPESKIRQSGKANNKKNSFFQSQLLRRKKKKMLVMLIKMKRVIQLRLRSIQAFVVRK